MRTIQFILTALISALISCSGYKPITVSKVQGVRIKSITQKGIEAELTVKIKNPNAIGFTIFPSHFNAKLNEMEVGNARLQKKVRIKGNSEEEHLLIISSDFSKLSLADIPKAMALTQGRGLSVSLDGDIVAGKFLFRKHFPVKLNEHSSLNRGSN